MRTYNNHNGFTLIELSVVLVIIGILVGLGSSMMGPMTNYVRVRETRDIQDTALQSVISWASSNNTIPHAFLTTDAANYVVKSAFKSVVTRNQDAWGRDIIYLYDANLYNANPTKDTICGRRSTPLSLEIVDGSAVTSTVTNVAFAVLSDADNATLKSTRNGTDIAASVASSTGITPITISVKGPNGYMARWVTLDELRSKIGCQGAPLKIVNNELPSGKAGSSYTATLTADGGVLPYKWCVERPATSPFSTTNSIVLSAPDTCNDPTASTWNTYANAISNETLSATAGSYKLSIYVRDSADGTGASTKRCDAADLDYNCAKKTFVLTINPP
jgi:prepilin-type N-terminal cleavage/methylation domain-containing protein